MEQNKWINQVLESANRIERVEASPFLYTRIEQKIKNLNHSIPLKWALTAAGAFTLLLILNFAFISKTWFQKPETPSGNELATSLGLNYSNQLYVN